MDAADDDPPGIEDRSDSPARGHHEGPPSRLALWAVIVPLVILVIANNVASVVWADWVKSHPLWLIGLSNRNGYLVLVADTVPAVSYYVIGGLRLFAPDPFFYLLGFWYGDAAVRWMERRSPTFGQMFRSAERGFAKAGYPLVFIAPNNYICLFAGAAAMPVVPFVIVNVAGTIVRLALFKWVGNVFSSPLDAVRDFITTYRIPIIAISAVLVGLTLYNEHRKGKGQVEELINLEEELEGEVPD